MGRGRRAMQLEHPLYDLLEEQDLAVLVLFVG
jgi:hypothetical protein